MSGTAAAGVTPGTVRREDRVFKPGGGRTTILSFLFLILLPFYASLPAMLYMRAMNGLWDDVAGLVLTAVAFTVVMVLLLIELMFSLRARVEIGESAVKLSLPSGRGATPMLRYFKAEIPYSDIDRVETRREIYGTTLTPVMLRGARIITKDGSAHRLGYVTETEQDAALPYLTIAEDIAARAGKTIVDTGNVRRAVHQKFFRIKAIDPKSPITQDTIDLLNGRHRQAMRGLIGALVLLVVVGISIDVMDQKGAWGSLAPMVTPTAEAPQKPVPSKPPAKPGR